jgi:hypothetical protein
LSKTPVRFRFAAERNFTPVLEFRMKDEDKTKEQLISELNEMRSRVAEFENSQLQKQPEPPDELRKLAEEQVEVELSTPSEMQADSASRLFHELRVHQIELALQNEKLRNALKELEESHTKYSDLYDFAPVGYLTLDEKGLIPEAIVTASRLLRFDRSSLINTPFSVFISMSDRGPFRLHLEPLAKVPGRHSGVSPCAST